MDMWVWILAACPAAFALKFAGYLVPARFLQDERILRVAGMMTIGLLASLTIVNTVATGQTLTADSRIGALIVAGIALYFKASFLVVVILGAVTAALLRLAGLP
ncbi:AzlD domain-containing protein [Neomicrococcus lactis]